jgi:thioester reductase-like protein
VSEIVHGAASVSFELGLKALRAINIEDTRRMPKFAQLCHHRGGLRRFSYISTAYVAGERAGRFSEDELEVGQSFRNAYEQSKLEAKCLAVRARSRIPITVLRPSIVVGECASDWTARRRPPALARVRAPTSARAPALTPAPSSALSALPQ